mgnify:CR=1 FL=1
MTHTVKTVENYVDLDKTLPKTESEAQRAVTEERLSSSEEEEQDDDPLSRTLRLSGQLPQPINSAPSSGNEGTGTGASKTSHMSSLSGSRSNADERKQENLFTSVQNIVGTF